MVLDKAVAILNVVATRPITSLDAAQYTGLNRSTTARILADLERNQLVVRDLLGRFALGPLLTELTNNQLSDPLQAETEAILTSLHANLNSDVLLFWAHGVNRICIACHALAAPPVQLGVTLAPSNCASALALLAWSAQRRWEARHLEVPTSQYETIRKLGWASSISKSGGGVLAVPVRNPVGEVVAALALFGSANLAKPRTAQTVAEYLLSATVQLSAAMGRVPQ